MSYVFIGATAVLGAAYWFYLADIIASVHHMVKHLRTQATGDKIEPENLKNLAQGSALLLGALVAAATLIFTLIRVWINERTTTAEEEGLITDRINAAVASLGAEKTIKEDDKEQTVPNIEVRIGAILALERMAKKNAVVYIQIMEILTAYIRENAPRTEEEHNRKPRQDIQLAFTVIGRRSPRRITLERMHDFRLDLRNCDLTRINGAGLDFSYANFSMCLFRRADLVKINFENAILQSTIFDNSKLSSANLKEAFLQKTDLRSTNLEGACLKSRYLEGTVLNRVSLDNTNLQDAKIRSAELVHTTLIEADLRGAEFAGGKLTEVNFGGSRLQCVRFDRPTFKNVEFFNAKLNGVSFQRTDLSRTYHLLDQLNVTFGDDSVILPEHLKPAPDHWDEKRLDDDEFHTKWEEWKKTLPPDGD